MCGKRAYDWNIRFTGRLLGGSVSRSDGSPVAVKLVAAVAQTSGERFEQECRLLQALRHDAIVRYRDHTVLEDGTGVLVGRSTKAFNPCAVVG